MRGVTACLFLLWSCTLPAQKVENHRGDGGSFDSVRIDARLISLLEVTTAVGREYELQYIAEGEYQEGVRLELTVVGKTLDIACTLDQNFEWPGDKLGAHKVLAVEIRLSLPADKNLDIIGDYGTVDCRGTYRRLSIFTETGNCGLTGTYSFARVRTSHGDITARLQHGRVEASSRYGTLRLADIPVSGHRYELQSTDGAVVVEHFE